VDVVSDLGNQLIGKLLSPGFGVRHGLLDRGAPHFEKGLTRQGKEGNDFGDFPDFRCPIDSESGF
jgi:hypothetical protein